jgi:surface protein
MTDIASTPFPDHFIGNDSVDNNLTNDEIPIVPRSSSTTPESEDSTWSTPTGKEFRSSFLFQSSCYLPDDEGTESESSYTDHTVHIGPLHRHEQFPKQSPSFSLDAGVTSILKPSDFTQSIASVQRRVMFTDDDKKIQATIGDDRQNRLSENRDGEEKSSWMGFGVSIPLHQFHSLPLIPSLATTELIDKNGEGIYCPPINCGDEEDGHNTISGTQSKTGVSTITYNDSRNQYSDGILSSRLFPRAKCRQYCCIMVIFAIVVGCMTTALTCGTLQCGRSSKTASTSSSTVIQEKESLSPSVAPSTTQPPPTLLTIAPMSTPTRSPKVIIRSTEELYDAVDAYILSRYNNSTDKSKNFESLYYNVAIGQWDVSLVTNFASVFDALRNPNIAMFNDDISTWDTSNAITMESMFYGAEKFNGNISTWKTHNVENMKEMFAKATRFDENISMWDVSKVVTMEGMCKCP